MIFASLLFLVLASFNIFILRQYSLESEVKILLVVFSVMCVVVSGLCVFSILDSDSTVSSLKLYGTILMILTFLQVFVISGLQSDFAGQIPKIGPIPVSYVCFILFASGLGMLIQGSFEAVDYIPLPNKLMLPHAMAFASLAAFSLQIENKYQSIYRKGVDYGLKSLAVMGGLFFVGSLYTMSQPTVDMIWVHAGGYLIALFGTVLAAMQAIFLQIEYPSTKSVSQYLVLLSSISLVVVGIMLTGVVAPQG